MIPLFIFAYRYVNRKILVSLFFVVGIFGGILPTVYFSIKHDINAFPMMDSQGYK